MWDGKCFYGQLKIQPVTLSHFFMVTFPSYWSVYLWVTHIVCPLLLVGAVLWQWQPFQTHRDVQSPEATWALQQQYGGLCLLTWFLFCFFPLRKTLMSNTQTVPCVLKLSFVFPFGDLVYEWKILVFPQPILLNIISSGWNFYCPHFIVKESEA